jgi:2-hydroxy-3-oxopropionate reductase
MVGLGVMGAPMAARLLAAGFPVTVHSRSAAPVRAAVEGGAKAVTTPADVARDSDVVVVTVGDTPDLVAVVDGPDGLLAGAHAGLVVCDMGTHDPGAIPSIAARFADAGATFLDAPVSGGEVGAREGSLSIMVGGDAEALARAASVVDVLGRAVRVGGSGAGMLAKACNQLLVASTIQAVAEALTLARASGLDPELVREVMLGGFAASRVLELHGRRMIDADYTPGGRVALHAKDARIILEVAARAGLRLPGFEPVAAALERLIAEGGSELDHSALITLLGRD